jgi:hyaluronoglucosaminidase
VGQKEDRARKWPNFDANGVAQYGGIPQNIDEAAHLAQFDIAVDALMPDLNYDGYAIIDMEYWFPQWEKNIGNYYTPIQTASKNLVRSAHPNWTESQIETQAKIEFEAAAKDVMIKTLSRGKTLRPNAKWGYYGYPYRQYWKNSAGEVGYSTEAQLINDDMGWLWSITTALVPSTYQIYPSLDATTLQNNQTYIRSNILESKRIQSTYPQSILLYTWDHYHPSGPAPMEITSYSDTLMQITIPKEENVDWLLYTEGDSAESLKDFLDTTYAPILKSELGSGPVNPLVVTFRPSKMPKSTSFTAIIESSLPAQFRIEYGQTPSFGQTTDWTTSMTTIQSVKVENLDYEKLYYYRVVARDQTGQEAHSYTKIFATEPRPIAESADSAAAFKPFDGRFYPLRNRQMYIPFSLTEPCHVLIDIYDRHGKKVKNLLDYDLPAADFDELISWDGKNSDGFLVPSGTYMLRLSCDGTKDTSKVVIIK